MALEKKQGPVPPTPEYFGRPWITIARQPKLTTRAFDVPGMGCLVRVRSRGGTPTLAWVPGVCIQWDHATGKIPELVKLGTGRDQADEEETAIAAWVVMERRAAVTFLNRMAQELPGADPAAFALRDAATRIHAGEHRQTEGA